MQRNLEFIYADYAKSMHIFFFELLNLKLLKELQLIQIHASQND